MIVVRTPEGVRKLTAEQLLILRTLDALGGCSTAQEIADYSGTRCSPAVFRGLHAGGWIRPRWRPPVTDRPHMARKRLPSSVRDGWELTRPLPQGW